VQYRGNWFWVEHSDGLTNRALTAVMFFFTTGRYRQPRQTAADHDPGAVAPVRANRHLKFLPAPYTNLVRYHGVFAGRARWRKRLPEPPRKTPGGLGMCPEAGSAPSAPVAQAALCAIGSAAQALLRERWPQAVAAELLQGVAVVGRHETRCVQREACDLGAENCIGGRVIEQLESELGERWLDGGSECNSNCCCGALERGIGIAGVGTGALDDGGQARRDLVRQAFDVGGGLGDAPVRGVRTPDRVVALQRLHRGREFSADPLFCNVQHGNFTIEHGSPCLPGGNTACGLIGAFLQGCGTTVVQVRSWGDVKRMYR